MKKTWVFMNVIALAVLVCVGNSSANTTPSADFDGDGIVGIPDFLAFVGEVRIKSRRWDISGQI